MTNYLCSNIKLLLEHQENNIKLFLQGRTNHNTFSAFFSTTLGRNLKKLANFFKLQSISILANHSQK